MKPEAVIATVCCRYDVSRDDIVRADKRRRVVRARWMICWLLRYRMGMSLPAISYLVGKHHTTVLHACSLFNPYTGVNSCPSHEYDSFDPARDWTQLSACLDAEMSNPDVGEAAE
jgi:hypothetical protein